MRIFITGGTGFVGRTLALTLSQAGHQIVALCREQSAGKLPETVKAECVDVDLFEPTALAQAMSGADAVIHLVGIIREFPARGVTFQRLHIDATRSVLDAATQAGIKRYLHMSANGTRLDAVSAYHMTKWQAEEAVRNSGLDWTIFRPSLIFGPEDEFVNMLAGLIRKLPVVPVMGDGQYRMQPVSVQEVAQAFTNALTCKEALCKVYHCGGADCLSYLDLLQTIGTALGKSRVTTLSQPLALMRPLVSILQHIPAFPMTKDQLQMLEEGNCCDTSDLEKDLKVSPRPFAEGLTYLQKNS